MAEFRTKILTAEMSARDLALIEKISANLAPASFRTALFRYMIGMAPRAARSIVRTELDHPYSFMLRGSQATSLRARSRTLVRSMEGAVISIGNLPALKVGVFRGPALKYAGVQDQGTVGKGGTYPTIIPRIAKALAIPLEPALTFSGEEKHPGGPRAWPNPLHFIPIRRGNVVGLLVEDGATGPRGGKLPGKAIFLLVRKVDLRAWHYLEKGILKFMPTFNKGLAEMLVRLYAAKE